MKILTTTMKNSILTCTGIVSLFMLIFSPIHAQTNDLTTYIHDNNKIKQVIFSNDGKFISAKSGESVVVNRGMVVSPSIEVWEIETGKKVMSMADRELARASCFSQDGSMLAFREKNNINIMDISTQRVVSNVMFSDKKSDFARPIAFTSDNKSIIIEKGTTSALYSVETGQYERDFYTKGMNPSKSSDDRYMIKAFVDNFCLYDFATAKEIHTFYCGGEKAAKTGEELKSINFTPDNRFVATLSGVKVSLWDLQTFKVVQSFPVGKNDQMFGFNSDGRYLVGGADTLKMWEVKTGKEISTPIYSETEGYPITCASFSPDSKYLSAGDAKGVIKVWYYSEENVAQAYYGREIRNEIKAIPVKDEFERTDEYNRRFQKKQKAIVERYVTQYGEKMNSESTLQEMIIVQSDRETQAKKERIANSLQTVSLKIESIGNYNADKESFTLKIVNDQEKYSRTETIKISRKDNPGCFKQSFQNAIITGVKQMSEDEKSFDIFNIKIRTSCPGREVEYVFGAQRKPAYIE